MIGAKVRDKCLRSFYNPRETSIQRFRYPNKFQEKYRKKIHIYTHCCETAEHPNQNKDFESTWREKKHYL